MHCNITQNCILSGLIGSALTTFISLGLFFYKEHIETQSCIKAIETELKCLYHICKSTFDKELKKETNFLSLKYPLNTDYFTIYHHNSDKIGKIPNDKKRELIISTYQQAKFFLDCLKTNNEAINFYEKAKLEKYPPEYTVSAVNNLEHSKELNLIPAYNKLMFLFEELLLK